MIPALNVHDILQFLLGLAALLMIVSGITDIIEFHVDRIWHHVLFKIRSMLSGKVQDAIAGIDSVSSRKAICVDNVPSISQNIATTMKYFPLHRTIKLQRLSRCHRTLVFATMIYLIRTSWPEEGRDNFVVFLVSLAVFVGVEIASPICTRIRRLVFPSS